MGIILLGKFSLLLIIDNEGHWHVAKIWGYFFVTPLYELANGWVGAFSRYVVRNIHGDLLVKKIFPFAHFR